MFAVSCFFWWYCWVLMWVLMISAIMIVYRLLCVDFCFGFTCLLALVVVLLFSFVNYLWFCVCWWLFGSVWCLRCALGCDFFGVFCFWWLIIWVLLVTCLFGGLIFDFALFGWLFVFCFGCFCCVCFWFVVLVLVWFCVILIWFGVGNSVVIS